MNWIKKFLTILIAGSLMVACNIPSSDYVSENFLEKSQNCHPVKHFLGNACIPNQIERIIVLDPQNLEALIALGIHPVAAAGFDSEMLFPSYLKNEVQTLETVGNIVQPNLEKILLLKPDLILGQAHLIEPVYDKLSKIAPTVATQTNSFSVWKEHLNFVAEITDQQEKATKILENYQNRVQQFQEKFGLKKIKNTTVSVLQIYQDSAWLFTKSRTGNAVLRDIGFPLPAAQKPIEDPGYGVPVSLENIAILDADIMFVSYFPEKNKTVALKYLKSPLWSKLKAVQKQQAYEVGGDYWGNGSIIAVHFILDDLFENLGIGN